jgi:hypothetical protein
VTTQLRTGGDEPLVAVVCEVPLLAEALAASLNGIAEIRSFPADLDDLEGLLRSLEPDAVVVDTVTQIDASERFARDASVPLLHVRIREGELRMLSDGRWSTRNDGDGASPEAIRNALVAGIFGRQHA